MARRSPIHSEVLELHGRGEIGIRSLHAAEIRALAARTRFRFTSGREGPYPAILEPLDLLLNALPGGFELVLDVTSAPFEDAARAVAKAASSVPDARVSVRARDANVLERWRERMPGLPVLLDLRGGPDGRPSNMPNQRVNGAFVHLTDVFANGTLTPLGSELAAIHRCGGLPRGAILVPPRGSPSADELQLARAVAFVSGIETDSVLETCELAGLPYVAVREPFAGKDIDTQRWSVGYARSNRYCHVSQDDGIKVRLAPYEPEPRPPPSDDMDRRVRAVEQQVLQALYQTPTYSGGGIGYVPGVRGHFAAEVTVCSRRASQASTVELAVTNVDPGRHLPPWFPDGRPRLPRGAHEMHSFFDTHGAPPYVGSEHDENDGFRVNWNLGTSYFDNQYGPAVGDGDLLEARLRLERRGPYFATYYRPADASSTRSWIVTGTVRNDSINQRAFLRCVGKRWRKADPGNAGEYLPVVDNDFVFRDFLLATYMPDRMPGPYGDQWRT